MHKRLEWKYIILLPENSLESKNRWLDSQYKTNTTKLQNAKILLRAANPYCFSFQQETSKTFLKSDRQAST